MLRFSHHSVKEYFFSASILLSEPCVSFFAIRDTVAHQFAAKVTLIYLWSILKSTSAIRGQHPFLQYSSEFWPKHVHASAVEEREFLELTLAKRIFNKRIIAKWLREYDPERKYRVPPTGHVIALPLYYSSLLGLKIVTESLLRDPDPAPINAVGGHFSTALQASSVAGNEEIVQLLLQNGASVNMWGGRYDNALAAAAFYGHKAVVELLLMYGADIMAAGGNCGTALQAAASRGHQPVVQFLVGRLDKKWTKSQCSRALHDTALNGYTTVVEMLLKNGACANAKGGHYGNALQAAAFNGHNTVVQLLL